MGRTRKPRCGHGNCFTCPYDDCIATEDRIQSIDDLADKKRGPGRPKLPDGLSKKHQLEYAKRHYQEIKEERSKYYKEYYQKNKERIHAQQKEYRDKRSRG